MCACTRMQVCVRMYVYMCVCICALGRSFGNCTLHWKSRFSWGFFPFYLLPFVSRWVSGRSVDVNKVCLQVCARLSVIGALWGKEGATDRSFQKNILSRRDKKTEREREREREKELCIFSLISDRSFYWGVVVVILLYDAIMSCLAGRNRPQPVLTTEINLRPKQHNPGENLRVINGSGFCFSGFQAVNTILSTAKHTLGQKGCIHPGGPRGTRYHRLQYLYSKLIGKIGKKFLKTNRGREKNKKKNLRRCSWYVNFIFWMAFLALFALLETKAGMAPRVAALTFDGQQNLSLELHGELYTPETGSRSNVTSLVWRRFDFLKNNDSARKTDRSTVGIVASTVRRSFSRERRKKGKHPPDINRPFEQISKGRYYPYKIHQHYNYFHPHYHYNLEHRRSPHHTKHNHNLNKPEPVSQEKGEEYEDDSKEIIAGSEELNGPDIPYRRLRRSIDTDEEVEIDPLERLSRVFGIKRLPSQNGPSPNQIPPEYMTRLYRSITDSGGLTKTSGPYNADIVRSFPDRGRFKTFSPHVLFCIPFLYEIFFLFS